jgi:DNA-binding NarL/FixJ family response regulator
MKTKKARIIIVDDEILPSLDLEKQLDKYDYHISKIIPSGEELLEYMKKNRKSPDLIIMDIKLSEKMPGIDAANYINSNYNIPVLFITSFTDEQNIEEARKSGSYGFIQSGSSE